MVRQAHHGKTDVTLSLSKGDLTEAAKILRRGGVVVFPTETAYGIGCDATNAAAVRKIFRIKERERCRLLPVIAADLRQAERFFEITGPALALARRHWPGPLTIVLAARDPRIRRALGSAVGVRVSSHRIPRLLASGLGRPIVATSANLSGRPTCYSAACVRRQLGDRGVGLIIDVGPLSRRKPSTVIRIDSGRVIILRPGPVRPQSLVPNH